MVNKVDKHIAKRIRQLRIEAGVSQEDMAVFLGFKSRVSLANIETFKQSITSKTIYLTCCIFNISPSELLPPIKKTTLSVRPYKKEVLIVKKFVKISGIPKI